MERNDIPSTEFKDSIGIITKDDEESLRALIKELNIKGGIIYINTPLININQQSRLELSGNIKGGIIGIKQSNNEYPRIDFKNSRDNKRGIRAINITGSDKFIKYLIVENSSGNGIYIKGNNNTLDHVISRYNGNSGIQISDGADSNTLKYCYSYRNCDVKTFGKNADGFAPKLGPTNSKFTYCFSWDNSDDGFDSFDKVGDCTNIVTYLHSASWNNGNSEVFIGKYDYDNGKDLDKNMWTIQDIISSDKNFENNYKNKKFSIENGKINGIIANEWLNESKKAMSGNGFKLGSKITEQSPKIKRIGDYCVTFDNKSKGFDNNNSQKCTGCFTNCVSFNNNMNYSLPYVFEKWNNNWSWGSKKGDSIANNEILKKPNDLNLSQKLFYSIRDKIIKTVYDNKFPDNINFDNAIDSLKI